MFPRTFNLHAKSKMKNTINLVALFAATLISQAFFAGNCAGQNFFKDYVRDAPVRYQPTDPWDRGVIFRNQTNHGGLFYNCDQEECKRDSPYICWKSATTGRQSNLDYWRRQAAKLKWRVNAGKCCDPGPYPGCQCDPAVCLACNVHPGSVDIDYSRLRVTNQASAPDYNGVMPGEPKQLVPEQDGEPNKTKDTSNLDYYGSSEKQPNRGRRSRSYRIQPSTPGTAKQSSIQPRTVPKATVKIRSIAEALKIRQEEMARNVGLQASDQSIIKQVNETIYRNQRAAADREENDSETELRANTSRRQSLLRSALKRNAPDKIR
jgi:hypothetical protein